MQSWTSVETQRAAVEGWNLVDCVNNGDVHVFMLVFPTDKRFKNSSHATAFVVERARTGSTFHQQALKLMTLSRLRPSSKRGKSSR